MFLGSPGRIGLLFTLNIVYILSQCELCVQSVDGMILQKVLFFNKPKNGKKADTCNIPEDLLMVWYMFLFNPGNV